MVRRVGEITVAHKGAAGGIETDSVGCCAHGHHLVEVGRVTLRMVVCPQTQRAVDAEAAVGEEFASNGILVATFNSDDEVGGVGRDGRHLEIIGVHNFQV